MRLVARVALRWLFPMAIGAAIAIGTMSAIGKPDVRHEITPLEPGVLYRSGQLDPQQLADEIHRRRIKTVVNLGSKTNWDVDVCKLMGVNYLELHTGDCWNLCGCAAPGHEDQPPAKPFDLTPLWKALDDPNAHPILIHCWGGIHRTGVVSAMYRIERQGWKPEDAIREMDLYGFESNKDKFADVVEYLQTYQGESGQPQQTAATEKTSPR